MDDSSELAEFEGKLVNDQLQASKLHLWPIGVTGSLIRGTKRETPRKQSNHGK